MCSWGSQTCKNGQREVVEEVVVVFKSEREHLGTLSLRKRCGMLNYCGVLENATGVLNQAHVLAAETASGVRSPGIEGCFCGWAKGWQEEADLPWD